MQSSATDVTVPAMRAVFFEKVPRWHIYVWIIVTAITSRILQGLGR